MPAAVGLRPDWDAKRVRAAAREARDADQARRLLAIAAAYEGHDRSAAAKIGAMGPQRLCKRRSENPSLKRPGSPVAPE